MKYNNKLIFTFSILIIFISSLAYGQVVKGDYHSYVKYADKIVKGQIVAKTPITYQVGKKIKTCGWILNIKVVESWKGGSENFTLYSSKSDVFLDPAMQYFIFAFNNAHYNPQKIDIDFLNCTNFNSTRADVSKFQYKSSGHAQHLFPLVSYDDKDQWMLLFDRLSNAHLPTTIERHRVQVEQSGNEKILEEMKYSDFIKEYLANL